ncbi:hypothetical protein J7443_23630 [Tropicibacter sp. R15_0]|uniref:hypothetical protein n=1 Tax=Tropicibacter sp. R15_0 TaxID=2821101 RepID=UPI001ADC9536|nr:hypothetical protein [Tropicibacter sp. R15_0]MBO9468238.1 hypothetical protein [Tropicibacter sp. R15_0]
MKEIFNVGETILLDGKPLSLVTRAGVEGWIEEGTQYRCRYDQVKDPITGKQKYRCLFEIAQEAMPFVLVGDPDRGDGRVILFDERPLSDQWPQALKRPQ